MAIEALEGVTDQELFDEANADEAPADKAVVETPEAPAEPEQPRDEAGRFAEKSQIEQLAEVAAEIKAEGEKPAVDDNAALVPSWRLRELGEEKRALADKLAAIEAERSKWQQPQAPRTEPAPEAKVVKPDPLLDPDGYEAYIERRVEDRILNDRREDSLIRARETNPTEFAEAYAAAQQQVDPVLKMKMQSSRDPGKTLIEWHREQKTRAEVGTDLNAFRLREQERLLSDPAFLAKAIEKARGAAQPQPGATRQPSAVSLPPSLTRATNASADMSVDDDDVSDEGLWRHANA